MKGNQCCGNCYFWAEYGPQPGFAPSGECRRYPMTVHIIDPADHQINLNPRMAPDEWCGEWWADKPDTADAVLLATARAVLAGDLTAAMAMADRLQELGEAKS